MTTLCEVAQQALEWADHHGEIVFAGGGWKAVNGMNAWTQALRAALSQQDKESLPDNCNIYLHMECVDCGHYQTVRGHRHDGQNYFGSGYDFCDKCDGVPKPIDEVTVDEDR